jgi:sugar phosphate isomerase/epimerase
MRFGVCCSLSQAHAVMSAGFDYVELPAGQMFGGPEEPDWSKFDGLSIEATNLFITGDLKLVGPEKGDVRGYAERIIPRAAKAGVQVMVVGSGAARRSPAGYDLDAAEDDFIASMKTCQSLAAGHEITIAPESLRAEETNVGNYLGDLARLLGYRGIPYTADSYHLFSQPGTNVEDPFFLENEMPFAPVHVHLSTRDRTWQVVSDPLLPPFVKRLNDLSYEGRISLECGWTDFEAELPQALTQVKALFTV